MMDYADIDIDIDIKTVIHGAHRGIHCMINTISGFHAVRILLSQ